jgi:hypothetical protein
MSDLLVTKLTNLAPAEVMGRAERYFAAEKWRIQSQGGSVATFTGAPELPRRQKLMAAALMLLLILPGVVYYYVAAIHRARREQKIAVSAKAQGDHCEVAVVYPHDAEGLMTDFLAGLV